MFPLNSLFRNVPLEFPVEFLNGARGPDRVAQSACVKHRVDSLIVMSVGSLFAAVRVL